MDQGIPVINQPGTTMTVTGTVASDGLTDAQLRATPVPVSGPATNTELRATPLPVSGTVTANVAQPGPMTVVGGKTTAPVANTVLADTGALAAGDYEIRAQVTNEEVSMGFRCEIAHRNAANNADIRVLSFFCPYGSQVGAQQLQLPRYTLAASERIVIRNTIDGSAAKIWFAMIATRPVT